MSLLHEMIKTEHISCTPLKLKGGAMGSTRVLSSVAEI